MQAQTRELAWEQPGWLEQITAWVQTQLAANGRQSAGPLELVRLRPWSAFAQVPTTNGIVYFKALSPETLYETALTQALARWRPDCTVPLLAVDLDRGWLLSADAGPTLHAASPSIQQLEFWPKLLALCVELQIEMAPRVPELLALGLADRRLERIPHLYAELMHAHASLRTGLEPGLTAVEHQRLCDLQPWVEHACQQLAAVGLPETLVHEEVTSTNVLLNGDRYIFTDWSEGVVTHPFFMMLVTLQATAGRLELAQDGQEMLRLRDAYLEPWTRFETPAKLLAAFKVAYRLAMVNRALSWHRGIGTLPEHHKETYAGSVVGWLRDFLHAEPIANS